MPLPHLLARPLIAAWLRLSPRSWRRRIIAADSPHLHAPGTNPDRVLLVGDGVATGRGVATHELGLPGHLARSLSALTGHATDVDIVVDQHMVVQTAAEALSASDLARFDTIILSVGHNEALGLMPLEVWRDGLVDLLDEFDWTAPAATPISILAIPVFGPKTAMPRSLARVVDRHARRMNDVTAATIAERPNATMFPTIAPNEFEPETAQVYRRWADQVARHIAEHLAGDRATAGDTVAVDEKRRQAALASLEESLADAGDSLDDLVTSARHMLGTPVAAVTFVHGDRQTFFSIQGAEPIVLPRDEAFCDVTIRRASHLVVEDARADSRYADFPVVTGAPGIRSYAGYPIESPDGHRVGALCVMDTRVRHFSQAELTMLRSMALLAQDRLWPTRS